jgi:hypothetical protein
VRLILVVLTALCLVAACGGPNPGDAVKGFFDAVKAGDGEKAAGYLSRSAVEEMGSIRQYMMSDESGVAELAAEMGVSADQLRNVDDLGFVALLLCSEDFRGELEGIEVSVGSSTIEGESATVQITYTQDGESDEDEIELVKEDGAWKLVEINI